MALLWIDGFDKYGDEPDASDPSTIIEWKYRGESDDLIYIRSVGGTGNSALIFNSATYLMTPHLTGNRTLLTGFRFKMRDVDNGAHIVDFRTPDDNGETVGYQQLATYISSVNSANEITVKRGATTLNISSGVDIQPDTWYYFEEKVYCDATNGTIEVKLDGSTVLTYTGNTQHRATYDLYSAILWRVVTPDYIYLDDVYICDGTGSLNNDFLGECEVQTLSPTSDVLNDWTADTGTDRYARIDEYVQDAGYIKDDTTGNKATFELDSLTINGTPVGAMICTEAQLNGKINKHAKVITSNGSGTLQDSGYVIPGVTNPLTSSVIMETDSDGGTWSASTINSLRIGVEVA